MTRSDPQYRLFLVILITLTILFLVSAGLSMQELVPTQSNQNGRVIKTATINHNQIEKPIQTSPSRTLLQASDLRQFNRLLFAIALERDVQNDAEKPIPYLLEEEGQNSIIYLHGDVHIRCWLELSNGKSIGKQCPKLELAGEPTE